MKFFVTGHTGFKGSWLTLLLKELGHTVVGFSDKVLADSMFEVCKIERDLEHHFLGDVRNLDSLQKAMHSSSPDVAIHLAAQSLVLESYRDPFRTYEVNVLGTLNFLEAANSTNDIQSTLVVTTDKVYSTLEKGPYAEGDRLGGGDPYSNSKALADLMASEWASSKPLKTVKIARAGNVIGAFDRSRDRLVPDIVRSIRSEGVLKVRNPSATRPWQHVLDCLWGYLTLIEKSKDIGQCEFNFGPRHSKSQTVEAVVTEARKHLPQLQVSVSTEENRNETRNLELDSSLANKLLGWQPIIDFETAIEWSLEELLSKGQPVDIAKCQVGKFLRKVQQEDSLDGTRIAGALSKLNEVRHDHGSDTHV